MWAFIKSPVWQVKSPQTGHEPDSKKCLVCEPDLMFVTHLAQRLHKVHLPMFKIIASGSLRKFYKGSLITCHMFYSFASNTPIPFSTFS